jgi:hypothetical protein
VTCPVFLEGCYENVYGNQGNEQVNMCGRKYNVGMYDWMDYAEHGNNANFMNNVVDKATEKFGPKPTPQQVAKMAKCRGITYQRNGNKDKGQSSVPKVSPFPPKSNVHINSDLNIDLGGWISNAKMLVPVLELMKIPSQRPQKRLWRHMGTCVRSFHMGRRAYENPTSTKRCSPISNISIHIYQMNK